MHRLESFLSVFIWDWVCGHVGKFPQATEGAQEGLPLEPQGWAEKYTIALWPQTISIFSGNPDYEISKTPRILIPGSQAASHAFFSSKARF